MSPQDNFPKPETGTDIAEVRDVFRLGIDGEGVRRYSVGDPRVRPGFPE